MWKADASNIVTPETIQAGRAESNRALRDALLRESDKAMFEDAPFDRPRWIIYRQALRDLDMTNPEWPSKPEGEISADEKLRVERVLDRAARIILFDGKNKA